jgi:hypothetical protein
MVNIYSFNKISFLSLLVKIIFLYMLEICSEIEF